MDQLIEQIKAFFQNTITILGEPITFQQIATFILSLIAVLISAGYLHRWFRRLFNRLRISHDLQNRLLAMLLLIIIIVGIGLAFRISGIDTGFLSDLVHSPLSKLFQPAKKPVATPSYWR